MDDGLMDTIVCVHDEGFCTSAGGEISLHRRITGSKILPFQPSIDMFRDAASLAG
jgi:hypothetical protein